MRVVGIDPAMANIGLWVGEYYPEKEGSKRPEWLSNSGKPNFEALQYVAKATHSTSNNTSLWKRINSCRDFIVSAIQVWKPDLVVAEDVLLFGERRNVSGGMVLAASLDVYRDSAHPQQIDVYHPQGVVLIPPPKLRSVAHGGKTFNGQKVTKSIVKDRYRWLLNLPKSKDKLTDHEADAYFLAYYGARFWCSCVLGTLPKECLTEEENRAFLGGIGTNPRTKQKHSTALLDNIGSWWKIKQD